MTEMPSTDDLVGLESEVLKNPISELARENLLWALSADPDRCDDPRRFELIEWFLEHNPRHFICTTPFMRVNPETAPAAFNPLTLNLAIAGLASIDLLVVRSIPSAARCLRRPVSEKA